MCERLLEGSVLEKRKMEKPTSSGMIPHSNTSSSISISMCLLSTCFWQKPSSIMQFRVEHGRYYHPNRTFGLAIGWYTSYSIFNSRKSLQVWTQDSELSYYYRNLYISLCTGCVLHQKWWVTVEYTVRPTVLRDLAFISMLGYPACRLYISKTCL